ncbi:MAG TPA: ArsC/Spx/MgsR family protein [Bacteroidales bacterium]|nr:ArsC/Spx/MgsR family protein [Bacteroidales bacterium]HPS74091.1 ArsC/Spx/MgsR family protein [Bacteroidales bacterium]
MLNIYHNPQCKKSRAGLAYLESKGVPFDIIYYLKTPMTEAELEKLLVKLNMKPAGVLRTQEEYFKKNIKGRTFTDHELIRIICENPRLLQRPIVEKEYSAVIGDPVENIDRIIP